MSRDFLTIVSRLPRSGTSLMMEMLAAGGIPPLTDELRPSDESNPRGYFEFDPVKRLRQDQSWLTQASGNRIIGKFVPWLEDVAFATLVGAAVAQLVAFLHADRLPRAEKMAVVIDAALYRRKRVAE
ncbi:MAG: hypothetical protein ACR2ID_04230 [Chthoniobacterales bacterium]